jgi:hypothetical protein
MARVMVKRQPPVTAVTIPDAASDRPIGLRG